MTGRAVKGIFSLLGVLLALTAYAQNTPSEDQYYLVDIELQTAEEFQQLLNRAEQLILAGVSIPRGGARVTFVLHGPVLENLLRKNYLLNKSMVDKAASLSALEVIDIKACNTWMMSHEVDEADLQPFIETVDYGPAVVKRLLQKNYLYF
jgi:intracellular sulfur oxidation DsrE/DsrF family protein